MIGGGAPQGICGSGLVDLMSELLRTGPDERDGPLRGRASASRSMRRDGIYFLESDVNELAQAKGANVAGLQVVCNAYGIDFDEIDVFYLAGGFGRHLKVGCGAPHRADSRICPIERIVQVGNAAIEGACIALLSRAKRAGVGSAGQARGALPAGDASRVLRFLRGRLPVQGGRIGQPGGGMTEWSETRLQVEVQPAEYLRLLGYPAGFVLEGRATRVGGRRASLVCGARASVDVRARSPGRGCGRRGGQLEGVRFHSAALGERFAHAAGGGAVLAALSAGRGDRGRGAAPLARGDARRILLPGGAGLGGGGAHGGDDRRAPVRMGRQPMHGGAAAL